jgi:outer membrane protein
MLKISSLVFFILASISVVFAEEPQKIYVVDVQKVVGDSIIGKAAKNDLEKELKKSEAKILGQRQELERMKQDLSKQKALLSKEALEQKGQEFRKKQRDLELSMAEEQDKIKRKNIKAIESVVAQVREILSELAESKEYAVVVEKDPRLVVYVSPNYDITNEVIKALDKKKID